MNIIKILSRLSLTIGLITAILIIFASAIHGYREITSAAPRLFLFFVFLILFFAGIGFLIFSIKNYKTEIEDGEE